MPKRSAADAGNDTLDWTSYTVPQLKIECKHRGLSRMGKKADLIARLEGLGEEADQAPATDLAQDDAAPRPPKAKKAKTRGPSPVFEGPLASEAITNQNVNRETGERRLRPFVPEPDDKFKDKLKRINKERMFMLDRDRKADRHGHPQETFNIAGSTGNIYTCTIGKSPTCDCMDAKMRGQKCKHINYALIIILKAPLYLQYQLAFMSEELEQIFANAPVTRAPDLSEHEAATATAEVVRKPVDGECPICVFDMEPGEEIVWCKAACGQNFHKECFEQWRRSKMGGHVTCVYCRSEWEDETTKQRTAMDKMRDSAPKIGSYKNIGHLSMYQKTGE